jgi:DNA-binding IclR family transcriptional regulator
MPKSSLHRLLGTLVDSGVVLQTPHGYELGDYLFDVVHEGDPAALDRLRALLAPHLLRLREQTGGVVGVGVLRGLDVRYVDAQYDARHAELVRRSPLTAPGYCTALGRALLAHRPDVAAELSGQELRAYTARTTTSPAKIIAELDVIRRWGVAVVQGEFAPDIVGAAVPLRVDASEPYVAISVWGPARQVDVGVAITELRRTARAITLDLANIARISPTRIETAVPPIGWHSGEQLFYLRPSG